MCIRDSGNDVDGQAHGYKIHLVYGAQASPSEKNRQTVNDSPEAVAFSWEMSTTPVDVPGFKPAAHLIIDSTKVEDAKLKALEDILYGKNATTEPEVPAVEPRLPMPAEIITLLSEGAG